MACPHVAGAVALFLSDGVPTSQVEDYLKGWSGRGHITDVQSDTVDNNMLLHIPGCVGTGADCTPPAPPPPPTPAPPGQGLVWTAGGTGCTVDAQMN